METAEWSKIEKDFIEWDNSTHSNASQRQILDWFKERIASQFAPLSKEAIEKKIENLLQDDFFLQGDTCRDVLYKLAGWIIRELSTPKETNEPK